MNTSFELKAKIAEYLSNKYSLTLFANEILCLIQNPSNLHGHARRDKEMEYIIPFMRSQYWTQQMMPNVLVSEVGDNEMGITSLEKLLWYRDHVMKFSGDDYSFNPIFSLFLNPSLSVNNIKRAHEKGLVANVKYYPKGGTTNSNTGIEGFGAVQAQLEVISELGIPLSMHGETPSIDGKCVHRDEREPVFYSREGEQLLKWYTGTIIAEHISTKEACDFVKSYDNVYATVTPQHLLFTNDAIYHKMKIVDDWFEPEVTMALHPSAICAPVLKPIEDLEAIWNIIVWQHKNHAKKVFLGDDTARHPSERKYKEGCACGVFNSPLSLEMYFMGFKYIDDHILKGVLSSFQNFASNIGLEVYGIPNNYSHKTMAIVRTPNKILENYDGVVTPFAGETIPFKAFDITEMLGL